MMIEETHYLRLKQESERTGRSIGELIREALDEKYGSSRSRAWEALRSSHGAWADRDDIGDGAEYVEQIRQPLGDRLQELGWD